MTAPSVTTAEPVSEPEGTRTPAPWALAQVVLVALTGVAVGWSFAPRVFAPAGAVHGPLVAFAGGAALVVAGLSVGRRWSPSSTFPVAVAVFTVLTAAVLRRAAPTPPALLAVLTDLRAAGPNILSHPLPVATTPELLVLPAAVVFFAVYAAGELAGRRRGRFRPVVPLVVAAVAPPFLGAGGPPSGAGAMALLVILLGALVLVRGAVPLPGAATVVRVTPAGGAPGGRSGGTRRWQAATGVAVLVVVALAAPHLGARLPGMTDRRPLDRRAVPRGDESDIADPLAEVNAELALARAEERFTVEAPAGLSLFRTTVLDRYEGSVFLPSLDLAPAGSVLPPATTVVPGGDTVTQRVTVRDWKGPFLPTAGVPVTVDGTAVRWDPRSTTLRPVDRRVPAGTVVTVGATVDRPDEAALAGARRDRTGADAREAARPVDQAAVIAQVAADEVVARYGTDPVSPDLRSLRALQGFLSDGSRFALSPQARTGWTLRQLTDLVSPPPAGTPEAAAPKPVSVTQLAAAFAVLARTQGFATRVAVGYRAPAPAAGQPYRLTSRDAFAWAEVKLEGLGWVPFVAGPRGDEPGAARPAPSSSTTTTAPVRALPPAPPASSTTTPESPGPDGEAGGRSAGATVVLTLAATIAGAVTVTAALALAAFVVRRHRRRGRARGAPAGQVVGAWREALDVLAGARIPVRPSMTAAEVSATTAATVGSGPLPELDHLGLLANRARFAPGTVAADTARLAWTLVDTLGRTLRAHPAPRRPGDRRRALLRRFDPRPPMVSREQGAAPGITPPHPAATRSTG